MQTTEVNGCQFMGKVTAGFTHEVKNVLAIIRESAGLLDDLLALDPYQNLPHRDKFVQRLTTIQAQVQRGVDLTSRLNRFAHSADEPLARVDLNELAAHLVALLERFARLKNVVLRVSPADPAPVLAASPLQLQRVLFLAAQCCWNRMSAGGELLLRAVDAGDEVAVEWVCQVDPGTAAAFNDSLRDSEDWTVMQKVATDLGGAAAAGIPWCGIRLTFPKGSQP